MLVNYQGWLRHVQKSDSKDSLLEFLVLAGCSLINTKPLSNYLWYHRFALNYRVEV